MKPVVTLAGVLLAAAFAAQAQPVKAPPLPPGSNLVKIEAGLNPQEKKRSERAHHHKGHHKKDMARDDSVKTNNGQAHNHGNSGNAQGAKK